MADEVTKPRPIGEEEVQDIQITLKSDANPMSVRELRVSVECDYKMLQEGNKLLSVIHSLHYGDVHCSVPEKIHTYPKEGHQRFIGRGGS